MRHAFPPPPCRPPRMKLLLVHSDFIEYKATKKALKSAPELAEADKAGRMEECLCAFVSVEKADEADLQQSVTKAAKEIVSIADQVKVKRVMLYPYAHLSNSLASPPVAIQAMPLLKAALPADYEVKQSPFGWYKAFSISCKGHPLSELSRHVLPDAAASGAAAVPVASGSGSFAASVAASGGSAAVAAAQAQARSSMKAPAMGAGLHHSREGVREGAGPGGLAGGAGHDHSHGPAVTGSVQSDEQNLALKAE